MKKRISALSLKSKLSKLLAVTTFALPLSLPLSASAQTPELVPGKQCIFNDGVFSLKVDWYNPGQVIFDGTEAEAKDYSKYKISREPAQTDNNVTVGVRSCTDMANRVAVARIVGHSIANNSIVIATGTATGIGTSLLGAVACVFTAGGACPAAAAAVGVAVSGAVAGVGQALPEVKEIAYLGSPGTKNYVDLSGTIWQVGVANNIPLNKPRGFRRVVEFVNDGEPGPRSISFKNEAGYVAEMVVMYFQKQDVGAIINRPTGVITDMPVTVSSGKIPLGFTRHIDIPVAISDKPVSVFIKGVATIKSDVYGTTLPSNFSGNKCYKSFGTIFDAQGSTCQ